MLDVGGTEVNWSLAPVAPSVVIVNLSQPGAGNSRPWVVADGRRLPFGDRAFDVAFSNSVIEHLGGPVSQQQFASEIARVAPRYYVQTPNRRFFIEPHLLTPLVHYFPHELQRRLLRNLTLWGLITRPTPAQCERLLREVRMLDEHELRELFPDAIIMRERVLGMTKSLIAVRM